MGKLTQTPFTRHVERAIDDLSRYLYIVTFTDDLSRYGYIYLMKQKLETFEKFKEFQNEVENHRDKKIKFLRSDHGGEYLSHEFREHLIEWNRFTTYTSWNFTEEWSV